MGAAEERISVGTHIERERLKSALLGTEIAPIRLGRFVIVRRLGAGGMGVVLEAYDPELERGVAIKVLGGHVAGEPEFHQRLRREARALASLSHRNVVAVYEVGVQDDHLFVVMELVRGPTMRAWLGECHRPWPQVLDAFVAAGYGLHAAHVGGLIHRDFKPDNVLLDEDGTPKVVDFGLVRAAGASAISVEGGPVRVGGDSDAALTVAPLGTPRYMAPEQAEGGDVDARSDQYSFCVALHEALSAGGSGDPPRRVAMALQRGMAHAPQDRWPSLAKLLTELTNARRPRRAWAVGGVLISGAAALALSWPARDDACDGLAESVDRVWSEQRADTVRESLGRFELGAAHDSGPRAVAALGNYASDLRAVGLRSCRVVIAPDAAARRAACLDNTVMTFDTFVHGLENVSDVNAASRATAAVGSLPDPERCLQPQPSTVPTAPIDARIAEVAGKVLAFELESAMDLANSALGQAERHADAVGAAVLRRNIAEIHIALGDYDVGKTALQTAFWAALAADDDITQARTAANLASMIAWTEGGQGQADFWLKLASGIASRGILGPEDQLQVLRHVAATHVSVGRNDEALATYREALAQATQGGGSRARLVAVLLVGRAALHENRLDHEAAEQDIRRAIESLESEVGRGHPMVLEYYITFGSILRHRHKLGEAREVLELALDGHIGLYGADHPDTLLVRLNLSAVYFELEDFAGALELLQGVPEAMSRTLSPEHAWVSVAYRNRCMVLTELERPADALPDCQRAHDISIRANGAMDIETSYSAAGLAATLGALGRFEDALVLRRLVIEILDAGGQPSIEARVELAETLWAAGSGDEAQAVLTEAANTVVPDGPESHALEQSVQRARAMLAARAPQEAADE